MNPHVIVLQCAVAFVIAYLAGLAMLFRYLNGTWPLG